MEESSKERIPDFQKLMYPILAYLNDDTPHPLTDVLTRIADHFKLSEEELRVRVASGQMSVFKNRITWAISYLKNAGLIFYPQRASYQITDIGKSTLKENINYINLTYLKNLTLIKNGRKTFHQMMMFQK